MMEHHQDIEDLYEEMVHMRRHMHMHPELSFKETGTKQYIHEQIGGLGLDIRQNVGGNGIVARLDISDDFETVALRADFDALPIQDDKDVSYSSTVPGVMHACGHDAHTAMLITTARILVAHRKDLKVNVVFIFQHAEEMLPGGAQAMIEDGALDGVDYIFGTHVSSLYPVGTLSFTKDFAYAAADGFTITVEGRGGHGAEPHEAIDPVVAGASLIQQLQSIVSRTIDPLKSAVVTTSMFNGGSSFNVIPNSVELRGTIRTFEESVKNDVLRRLNGIMKGIESSFEVTCTLNYQHGYPALLNDNAQLDRALHSLKDATYVKYMEENPPSMGGEDFAYFLQKVPGCYFYTGVRNSEKGIDHPHHHPLFDIDENGLKAGVESLCSVVLNFNEC